MPGRAIPPRMTRRVVNWLASDAAEGIPATLTTALLFLSLMVEGEGLERAELSTVLDDSGRVDSVLVRWRVGPRELRVAVLDWREDARHAGRYRPVLSWMAWQRVGHVDQWAGDGNAFRGVDEFRRWIDWVHGGSAIASMGGIEGVETRGW